MSVLSSKDSFKRIDLDAINLDGSSDSSISLDASTTIPVKFVYVGTGGNVQSAISTDAVTWTENQSAFGMDGNPRIPVVANSDSTVLYTTGSYSDYISTDGLSWTTSNVPMEVYASTGYSIYANGKFVVLYENSGSPLVRSSTDAVTWTVSSTPGYGQYMAYGNGKYLYYSQPNGSIITSTDAITWTETPHTGSTSVFARIMFANNQFIRYGGDYYYYESSTDGVSWTQASLPPTAYDSYTGMAYGNNIYLALSYAGDVYSSTDLVNWNSVYNSLSGVGKLSFTNGKFYATADDSSSIFSSTDGATWLQSSKLSYSAFSSVGGNIVGTGININSSGISTTADITANKFIGDGSSLTGVTSDLSDYVTKIGMETISNKTIQMSTLYGSNIQSSNLDGTTVLGSNQGKIPAEYIARVDQDRTLTNNTTYQNIFDSGNQTVSLDADTLYYIKGIIYSEKTATNSNAVTQLRINLNGNAPQSSFITGIYYNGGPHSFSWTTGTQSSGFYNFGGSDNITIPNMTSAVQSVTEGILNFEGWIKTNSATNVTFTLSQSVVGTSAGPKIKANTYVSLKPMTGIYSGSTLISGPWS